MSESGERTGRSPRAKAGAAGTSRAPRVERAAPPDPAPRVIASPPAAAPGPSTGAAASARPPWIPAPLLWLGSTVLVLVGALVLREVADLLVPFLFGLFIALVSLPLVAEFERRGAGPRLALTLTIALVIAVVVVSGIAIALSLVQLLAQVPAYEDRLGTTIAEVRDLLAGFGIATDADAVASVISPGSLASLVRPIVSTVSAAGIAIFVLALTLVYALADARGLRARAVAAFGAGSPLLPGVERFGTELRRYLVVRAQLGLIAGVLVLVWMWLLGVPFAFLWAFLTFAASFIPNIGTLIALVPPTILALLDGGLVPAALVVAGYGAVNLLQDYVLQPRLMGDELNVSPLVVFISIIAWSWVLGAAGALLAVPMTVGLILLLEAFPTTRGTALLMRNHPDPAMETVSP